jgi:hypothetical protein
MLVAQFTAPNQQLSHRQSVPVAGKKMSSPSMISATRGSGTEKILVGRTTASTFHGGRRIARARAG